MKWLVPFALCFSAITASAQGGIITIFRESPKTFMNYKAYADADRNPIPTTHIEIDGQLAVALRNGRFISVRIPAGHHIVRIREHSRPEDNLALDIKENEHIFVRPQVEFVHWKIGIRLRPMQIECREAIELGRKTDPSKGKDVGVFSALQEIRFPEECHK